MDELIITKYIPVPLDDTKRKEINEEMVAAVLDRDRLEELLKDITKKNRDIIKVREKTISEHARLLNQGHTMQPIRCKVERLLNTNTVNVIRMDTNVVIETREMSVEERKQLVDGREQAKPKHRTSAI